MAHKARDSKDTQTVARCGRISNKIPRHLIRKAKQNTRLSGGCKIRGGEQHNIGRRDNTTRGSHITAIDDPTNSPNFQIPGSALRSSRARKCGLGTAKTRLSLTQRRMGS